MAMRTNKQRYDLGINTDCFRALDKLDQSKVTRRRQGSYTTQPRSNYGRVLWDIAFMAWQDEQVPDPDPPDPPPPDPNPDPHYGIAPRTYNYAPSNNSDPRFCVHNIPGVEKLSDGRWHDKFSRYDDEGRDVDGGRTRLTQVPGLRQADNSDGKGECELYDKLTEWPEGSYER